MQLLVEDIVEFVALFVYIPIIVFWLTKHYLFLKNNKNTIGFPLLLALIFILFLYYFYSSTKGIIVIESNQGLKVFAFLMMLVSILVDIIAITQLSLNFNIRNKSTKLVSTGIYKYLKHPIYLSHLNFCFSSFIFNGRFINLIVFICWFFAYFLITKLEEQELIRRFGDEYINYSRNKIL
ncbi:MAG: NnrU family protein [Candidatus Micrarchaeota archaeon]|nr:NnrU family protein [Candidatus Micrarchaeota archaeon]